MTAQLYMWCNKDQPEASVGSEVQVISADRVTAASVVADFLKTVLQEEDRLMKVLHDVNFTVRFDCGYGVPCVFHHNNEEECMEIYQQFGFIHPVGCDDHELMALMDD